MKKEFRYLLGATAIIILVTACIALSFKKSYARDGSNNSEVVIVREYFTSGGFVNVNNIVIAYPDNKTEVIELGDLGVKYRQENTSKLEAVLAKLINNGYTLVGTNGSGGGQSPFMINTYVLKK